MLTFSYGIESFSFAMLNMNEGDLGDSSGIGRVERLEALEPKAEAQKPHKVGWPPENRSVRV